MKQIVFFLVVVAMILISGCVKGLKDTSISDESDTAGILQTESEPWVESGQEAMDDPILKIERVTGNVEMIDAPFGPDKLYLTALGNEVVEFDERNGVLVVKRYDPLAGMELPTLTVHDFWE